MQEPHYGGGTECGINRPDQPSLTDIPTPPSSACTHLPASLWYNSGDMEVNPNCDHGNILLNHGNKNQAEAGRTLQISGHV